MRALVVVVVVLATLQGACQSQSAGVDTAAVPTAPAPTPTPASTPGDQYAIPADPANIDAPYVERVIERLGESYVDAIRLSVAAGRVTPEAEAAVRKSHLPEASAEVIRALRRILKHNPAGHPFRKDPIDGGVTVKRLVSADFKCIFALVEEDTSGLLSVPIEPFELYYQLVIRPNGDSAPNSQTPWIIAATSEPLADGSRFLDPCKTR